MRRTELIMRASTVLTFFILSYIISSTIRSSTFFGVKYGINISILIWIFGIAEIFFNFGIFLMLKGSGFYKIGFKKIIHFQFDQVNFKGKQVFYGFWINRASALLPWFYPLVAGWGKLPKGLIFLIFFEMFTVVTIGTLIKIPGHKVQKYA